jgi:hypothetical protein
LGARPLAAADRARATELLPKDTAAFIHIPSAPGLGDKFRATAMGRMMNDTKIKPLVQDLYGAVIKEFAKIEEQIGLSLPQILSIPQGEFSLAVVAPEDGKPQFAVLLDAGDQIASAEKLIEKATGVLEQQGLPKSTETVDGTKLTIYELPDREFGAATFFQKDKTVAITTNTDLAKLILSRWSGVKDDKGSLSKNPRYNAIMSRVRGSKDQQPQATWFVDPISIVKSAAQGDLRAATALAFLPVIGLDGFSGVGGSMTFDVEPFDYIGHMHVLIENPRTGVMKALALKDGELTPQSWVPADVASYTSLHWDFGETYKTIAQLVDSFQGEGTTAGLLKRFGEDQLSIDLEKDVIDQLSGRVTHLTWIEQPVRLTSMAQAVALEVKDPKAVSATLAKLSEKFPDNSEALKIGSLTYYKPKMRGFEELPEEQRPPQPCVAVYENSLLIARENFLKKLVVTDGKAEKPLAESMEYKLVAGKIDRLAGGKKPGLLAFNQPEQQMKMVYDLATSDSTREWLKRQGEGNEFIRSVDEALAKNPLPPFSVIQQYLAPGGSLMLNEETGFHFIDFVLKR